jgi:hypothetical protein
VITIDNPKDPVIQAIFLKPHLRMLARGMKSSRMTGKQVLQLATDLTGNTYKRGQYHAALTDLVRIIDGVKP